MTKLLRKFVPIVMVLATVTVCSSSAASLDSGTDWKQVLRERLPLYGHRNWIVVADSAYPAQTGGSIETIVSNANQVEVVKQVLESISASKHVRPLVYVDKELPFVDEKAAPGVLSYRQQLAELLKGQDQHPLLHEQIISKLDQVSHNFRVLIIKTNMAIPYTSVFLELRASYWSDENERKLRTAMGGQGR